MIICGKIDLKKFGLKKTKIRQAILCLFEKCRPYNAVELISELDRQGLSPNKTTVYRELEKLQRAGVIQAMSLDGKTTVYELYHHHHLVCLKCQRYIPIDCDNCLSGLGNQIKDTGFFPVAHSLNLFGYCNKCK